MTGLRTHWPTIMLLLSVATGGLAAGEPQTLLLWPAGAPGAHGKEPQDIPQLLVYLAPSNLANGAAIVICPGGGYGGLAMGHEGHDMARWFNSFGVAGLIVDYRHRGKGYGHPAPLQDAQRAVRIARARASDWKLDTHRVGIIGFSAGGHLASSVITHFDAGDSNAADPVERQSCRPDFAILCYPVIAFDQPYTHKGSQYNLLGKDADKRLVASLSSERQVTPQTPPTFLWTTDEDKVVPAENSVMFYLALRKAHVPSELHVFAAGRHGLGLATKTPGTRLWTQACRAWLVRRGIVK